MSHPQPIIRAAGDAAVMIDLGQEIDVETNGRVHALARRFESALAGRAIELVPGYASLLVSYDPRTVSFDEIAGVARSGGEIHEEIVSRRRFVLPVAYGGEFGPDLIGLAEARKVTVAEIIRRHAEREHPIFCMGFAPGFPFLGNLDPILHTPRRNTPRPAVPAGSVAIGGRQTGVYPTAMPGGWHLIGRCPLRLFDVTRDPPVAYRPGDSIQFEPIDLGEFQRLAEVGAAPEAR